MFRLSVGGAAFWLRPATSSCKPWSAGLSLHADSLCF